MLVISRRSNETLLVGESIEIRVLGAKSDSVRLGIVAPNEIKVVRGELLAKVMEQNLAATEVPCELFKKLKPKTPSSAAPSVKVKSNSSQGPMVRRISHDIRNYLTPILGETDLALMDCEDELVRDSLQVVKEHSGLLLKSLSDLDLLTGKQLVLGPPSSVREQLELCADMYRESMNMVIDCPQDLEIASTKPMLGEILGELIRNAQEAQAKDVELKVQRVGQKMLIEVKDNGGGVDRVSLSHLGEPFFTTKSGHRGLGLAKMMGWLKAFEGSMQIASTLGRGTTLTLEIGLGERVSRVPSQRVILRGLFRGVAHRTLEQKGYQVLLAEDDEQMAVLRKSHPGLIDVVESEVDVATWSPG